MSTQLRGPETTKWHERLSLAISNCTHSLEINICKNRTVTESPPLSLLICQSLTPSFLFPLTVPSLFRYFFLIRFSFSLLSQLSLPLPFTPNLSYSLIFLPFLFALYHFLYFLQYSCIHSLTFSMIIISSVSLTSFFSPILFIL